MMGYNERDGAACNSPSRDTDRSELTMRRKYSQHGQHHRREYNIWKGMLHRCHNPESKDFPRWGGRGITVCERWRESVLNFIEDMSECPGPGYSIDRIDNDRGYTPDNCRWATQREQGRNTRVNHLITHNGETLTLVEWSERTGIGRHTIAKRLGKYGWSVERALTGNIQAKDGNTAFGKTLFTPEWSLRTGIPVSTINMRLWRGWTPERAVSEPVHARTDKRPARAARYIK